MKIYTASKFSIVIVSPKLSEKTKESKLLVRSFRHIYKVAGLGIATGISGLLSAFQLEQPNSIPVDDSNQFASEMSEKQFQSSPESSARMATAPVAESDFDDSLDNFDVEESIQIENFANEEVIQMTSASNSDLFLPLMIITAILGGLTIFYLVKYFRK